MIEDQSGYFAEFDDTDPIREKADTMNEERSGYDADVDDMAPMPEDADIMNEEESGYVAEFDDTAPIQDADSETNSGSGDNYGSDMETDDNEDLDDLDMTDDESELLSYGKGISKVSCNSSDEKCKEADEDKCKQGGPKKYEKLLEIPPYGLSEECEADHYLYRRNEEIKSLQTIRLPMSRGTNAPVLANLRAQWAKNLVDCFSLRIFHPKAIIGAKTIIEQYKKENDYTKRRLDVLGRYPKTLQKLFDTKVLVVSQRERGTIANLPRKAKPLDIMKSFIAQREFYRLYTKLREDVKTKGSLREYMIRKGIQAKASRHWLCQLKSHIAEVMNVSVYRTSKHGHLIEALTNQFGDGILPILPKEIFT